MTDDKTDLEDQVFRYMCNAEACCMESRAVVSSKHIAYVMSQTLDVTVNPRQVLGALHRLRARGLVKRGSIGIPAFDGTGEYKDDWHDAAPPRNGWILTEKAIQSDTFKKAYEDYCESLRKWAEGDYESGTGESA